MCRCKLILRVMHVTHFLSKIVSMKTLEVTAYRIRRLLADTGWSQAELGRLVGVSQQTVQRWATGVSTPNHNNLDQLSERTGRPIFWFMLPPEEEEQVVTPASMKLDQKQLELLRTFSAFPGDDQDQILNDLKETREKKQKEAEKWYRTMKGK